MIDLGNKPRHSRVARAVETNVTNAPQETPNQTKKKQTQDRITEKKMPDHDVSAQIAGDDQAQHTGRKQPMKEAGGEIPNANFDHRHFHPCKK